MKRLLKKIFPVLLLKKGFLIYNKLLLKFYYPFMFPAYNMDCIEYVLDENKNVFLESIDESELTEKNKEDFKIWIDKSWTQNQYIVKLTIPHKIDPSVGWALVNQNQLVYASLGFSHATYLKRPSLFNVVIKKPDLYLDRVISFRDTGELNYFHFFNDVLAKFYFLNAKNLISIDDSLVISSKLYETSHFQYFLKNTRLKDYKWVVQNERTIISSKASLFCKPYTHSKSIFEEIIKDLNIPKENLYRNKKIYLTRSPSSLRYISNEEFIIPILQEKQFEIIDTSSLSFEHQVLLFSSASVLIGIHGAGLTNMMFRNGGQMELMEIFSPYIPYNPFHYILMAKMFGFKYSYMNGQKSNSKFKGGFNLSKEDFLINIESK